MGANDFQALQAGADAKEAFLRAVQNARYESGSGGYTGTIAEKDSFVVIQRDALSEAEARNLARRLISDCDRRVDDKWGPAGAIPVVTDVAKRWQTVSIAVDGPVNWDTRPVWEKAAADKLKLKSDEVAVNFRAGSIEPKIKVVSEATKGKTETRYIIEGSSFHSKWETGFASQAEARAKAVELASKPNTFSRSDFSIVGVTKRLDGSPLVTVAQQVTKTTAEVEVTIVKKVKPGTPPDAWLFFGIASC